MKIKSRYVTVQGWMVDDLGLTGNKLLAYAIIYGFSQDGESKCYASLSYFKKWLGLTHNRDVIKILNELVESGLVKKESRPGETSLYYAAQNSTTLDGDQCQNGTTTSAKMALPQKKFTDEGSAKMAHDNNIYNKLNNKCDLVMVNNPVTLQDSQETQLSDSHKTQQTTTLEASKTLGTDESTNNTKAEKSSGLDAHAASPLAADGTLRWPVARRIIKDSFFRHTGKKPMMPRDLEERYNEVCENIGQPLTLKVLEATLNTYFDTKWIDSPSVRGFLSPKVWDYVGTEEYVTKID